jgi:methionyl-tRNA synthetase
LTTVSKYYVTTPIYYATDVPHIGHTYTTVIGDAMTRWRRMMGDDVFYLTGTDEHGLKMARAAEAQGITPRQLADKTSIRYRETWDALNIRYDQFIRTTEERHYKAVSAFLQAVYDNGDIELRTYEGLYCVSCEAYYTEDEAPDGNCPIHLRPIERMQEENYFFLLSRYEQKLLDWIEQNPTCVQPETRKNEVLGFIRGGLQDISISRSSITWGVPLPWDPKHVAWVWFDALPNYITAAGYAQDDAEFNKWWPVDHHLVGKDILRFHAVFWPAMLMSAGLQPPQHVSAHGWLLVGGEKMSKTRLNQIFPQDLADEYGVDGLRYYLLRDTTYGNDGDLSFEQITQRYNSDLANNLGNLLARVVTVVQKKCGGIAPSPTAESPLRHVALDAYEAAKEAWENVRPSDALDATWRIVRETNAMLEQHEPWKAEPGAAVDAVMGNALEALRIVAIMACPAIPSSAQSIWERIGLDGDVDQQRIPDALEWGGYTGGKQLEKAPPLFPRKQAAE